MFVTLEGRYSQHPEIGTGEDAYDTLQQPETDGSLIARVKVYLPVEVTVLRGG